MLYDFGTNKCLLYKIRNVVPQSILYFIYIRVFTFCSVLYTFKKFSCQRTTMTIIKLMSNKNWQLHVIFVKQYYLIHITNIGSSTELRLSLWSLQLLSLTEIIVALLFNLANGKILRSSFCIDQI